MVLNIEDGKVSFDDQLLCHIRNGNHDMVLDILNNVDVKNLIDSSGMTLLHHSVLAGNARIVEYLTKRKCKVDIQNHEGNTPLTIAVMHGHESIVEILLEAKANVFLLNQDKQTPLSLALAPQSVCNPRIIYNFFDTLKKICSNDSRRIASLLINVNCPFPRVMYFEDVSITEKMLNEACDVDDRDPENGSTALHYAVKFHDINNIKFLLERAADINAEDKSQRKPLHHYESPMLPAPEILTIFLEHGTVLDTHNKHDYNLAGYILQWGDTYEVKALLQFNIDFNAKNARGKSLMSFAVKNTNAGVIELLQDKQFDVNSVDKQQRTALWYAISAVNIHAVQFLLTKGANPNNVLDALSNNFMYYKHAEDSLLYNQRRIKCIELLLQYGFNLLSMDVKHRTVFEIALEERNLKLLTPVLEYVAIISKLDRRVNKTILAKIKSHAELAKYFDECLIVIEAMKVTVVHDPHVTLFNFLMASKEQLLNYAQNTDTVKKMRYMVGKKSDQNFRFIENLLNCIEYIIKIAELRKKAALKISKIVELQGSLGVIDKIVMFLDEQSLENVCKI